MSQALEEKVARAIPAEATCVRLAKFFPGDDLRMCECLRFDGGRDAIDTVFRRAAISGFVDIGGEIKDHFADILDDDGSIVETVALDAKSFKSLKDHWMRCKYEDPRAMLSASPLGTPEGGAK